MEYVAALKSLIIENHIIGKLVTIALILVAFRFVRFLLHKLLNHAEAKGMDTSAKPLVESLVGYSLNLLVLLLSLHILGVNTAGVLAIVGAASLAIGLALKDMLSNIASGLLLLFLKPFKAGDYIECGNIKGKISGIGLFNTIFETVDGIYVSAPNSSLWGAPILNFSRNSKRRLEITVGISYDSDIDTAKEILNKLILNEPRFHKSPIPDVAVTDLCDSSVNLRMRVWVNNVDFFPLKSEYTTLIKKNFEAAGIEIPFPQRTVHIVQQ